ncbi:MAG: CHASE2 domain-containing protein [Prochloraceae cyanobacterium]
MNLRSGGLGEQFFIKKILNLIDKWSASILLPAVIVILILGLRYAGLLQIFELQVYDFYVQRPFLGVEQPLDDRFVIVGITEKDFREFKEFSNYPVRDRELADLLDKILAGKPAAIGLDLYRDVSYGDDLAQRDRMDNLFKNTSNLIGIEKAIGEKVAAPPALEGTDRVGANDLILDPDGFLRRGFISFYDKEGRQRQSFGFLVAYEYLVDFKGKEISYDRSGNYFLGNSHLVDLPERAGSYVKVHSGGYQFLINWRIPPKKWHKVRVADVLRDRVSSKGFEDKIVLIGPLAPSLNDFFNVPYYRQNFLAPTKTYGVEVQANLIKQLIDLDSNDTSLIKFFPEPIEIIFILSWFVFVYFAIGFKSFLRKPQPPLQLLFNSLATIVLFSFLLFVFTYLAFIRDNYWLPFLPSELLIVCGGVATSLGLYVDRTRQNNRQLKILNDQVKTRNEQLKILNEDLDLKVQERTKELEQANSELKETYLALQDKTKELIAQEKLTRLGLMVKEIQHDLALPVGAVYGNSILLKEQINLYKNKLTSETPEQRVEFLKFLEEIETNYLKNISLQAKTCKDFLDSFDSQNSINPSEDRQKLVLKEGNFNKIISVYFKTAKKLFYEKRKTTLSSLSKDLGEAHRTLRIKKELDENIPNFYLDSNALSRVITNLLLNAFDTVISKQLAIKSPDYQPTVTIKSIDRDSSCLLIVEDNGEGISESDLGNIFDPSYSTKRKMGRGSGLGLYAVYNLIRCFSGGTIKVRSRLGEGTTFTIEWKKQFNSQIEVLLSERKEILFFDSEKS